MFYNDSKWLFFLDWKNLNMSTIFALFVIFHKKIFLYHYVGRFFCLLKNEHFLFT